MTRKSRRELERAADELDDSSDVVDYVDQLRYLERVADEGAGAPLPAEHFGDAVEWGRWADIVPDPSTIDLPPDVDAEALTPPELFGLAYCGAEVRLGILQMRQKNNTAEGAR